MESKHFIQLSKGEVMAMAFPLKRWDDRVAIRGMAIKIHRLVADLDGMQLDAEA
jgi:hypothetical protein